MLRFAIYREGVKTVAAGANPMAMKRGIEKAVNLVCGNIDPKTGERAKGELDKLSKPVTGDMIAQVGSISARRIHICDVFSLRLVSLGSCDCNIFRQTSLQETTFRPLDTKEKLKEEFFSSAFLAPNLLHSSRSGPIH